MFIDKLSIPTNGDDDGSILGKSAEQIFFPTAIAHLSHCVCVSSEYEYTYI